VLLSPVALIPLSILLAAVPADDGRLPDPGVADLPPTVYCCDLDGNCVVAVDGEPCSAAELGDVQSDSQAPPTPQPTLRRTLADSQLPAFDTNFRGEWGDFLRWLQLNPAVPYIVEGTVVGSVGELGVLPDNPREVYLTRCTVEVVNAFKGSPGSLIEYHVLGGVIPGHGGMIAYHSPGCRMGDTLLLFLQDMGGIVMPAHGSFGSITLRTREGVTDPANSGVREFYLGEVML
jgi:hypothetical protein